MRCDRKWQFVANSAIFVQINPVYINAKFEYIRPKVDDPAAAISDPVLLLILIEIVFSFSYFETKGAFFTLPVSGSRRTLKNI